uniref:NADH-ubiquinone oxidoreductase chain 3 n=1 Tax=Thaumaglossa rufocapillata TaxID=3080387 RepID=A0AA96WRI9_9COLE|nr:NADH dehydrogenase subunit 3 [Thaumaglossa rufocapillata]WNZ33695.1 NADH dehydrogenase subunit 3 [Thaumaglossa rufocapillata]
MLMISSIMLLTISTLMMSIASILSKKSMTDREKNSPFECGFDPKTSARIPFSIQFFLIAIIFLVFDVEITLLIPIVSIMGKMNINYLISFTTSFILILLMGLINEWYQGALNWSS